MFKKLITFADKSEAFISCNNKLAKIKMMQEYSHSIKFFRCEQA